MRVNMKIGSLMLLISVIGIGLAIFANWRPKPPLRTIYVPIVQARGLSRGERLRMTEMKIKSIERTSPLKVVGSPERADVTYDWSSAPAMGAGPGRR